MVRMLAWLRRWPLVCGALFLLGCASTQLNYNTLDLASTVDNLVTSQVLTNLAKFIASPHAIPSQVTITTGTATTNNTISPSINTPANALTTTTSMAALTAAATRSTTVTNVGTNTTPNTGLTVTVTDQWTQTWGMSPITDPD
jgi:hypothetical protein